MIRTLLALVLLTGCAGSDFVLVEAPPRTPEVVETGSSAPSGPVGAPGSSMWDDLGDLGDLEIPDEYWFVHWRSTTDGTERFDAIDVLGRSVASFAHPTWHGELFDLGAGDFDVVDLVADSAGSVYVVEAPRTYTAWSEDGLRYVWRADATTGAAEYVLVVDARGVAHLPLAGGKVGLPGASWLQDARVAPDPVDPDVLWLLALDSIYYGVSGQVVRIDLREPDAAEAFDLAKTTPASLTRVLAFDVLPGPSILLGVEGWWQHDDAFGTRFVTVDADGAPTEAPLTLPETEAWWGDARLAEGTASMADPTLLLHSSLAPGTPCGWDPLVLVDRASITEIAPVPANGCVAGATLLDPAGPTLLYGASTSPGDYYIPPATELRVHHRGADVHVLDQLRVGLATHDFELLRTARLQAP